MSLRKAKTIASAKLDKMLGHLPVDEAWYKERREICGSCEYNSKNVPKEELTFLDKRLCLGGERCTACGCCVDLKTSVKTAVCGLEEIKKTPKWFALEVDGDDGLTIINLDSTIKTTQSGKEFLIDFGGSSEKVLKFNFNLHKNSGVEYSKWAVACGCTHVENIDQVDINTLKVIGTISTLGFRTGLNEKTLTIEYKNRLGKYKTAIIRFRVIKM